LSEIQGSVRVVGGAAPVKLRQVMGGEIYVETTAGDVDLGSVAGSQLLVTGEGAIIGNRLSGSVEFRTASGGVDVAKAAGHVSGRTGKGDIRVEMLSWSSSGRALIESEKGSIE